MATIWKHLVVTGVLAACCVRADVVLPHLFTDHMLIQRDRPIHVWGKAEAGEDVSVSFQADTQSAKADELGRWSVYLKPQGAGGPFQLTVKGSNTITLQDVLVGDVWLASGQSNMEFHLRQTPNAKDEVAAANYPKIRFFRVNLKGSPYPLDDVASKGWAVAQPDAAPEFSAVGYFFARALYKDLDVPIGVIDTSWGGAPLAAFVSMTDIGKDAALMPAFAQWGSMIEQQSTTLLTINKETRDYEALVAQAKAAGKPVPPRQWFWHPPLESWAPAGIYDGMIAPITPYAIRGAIWYQGESDAGPERSAIYAHLFQAMITGWRQVWGMGDFPFLYVQLPNFIAGTGNAWPELREAQLQTLALRKTGMAVAIDVGTPKDIHPPDKLPVGTRLSLAARAIAYGENVDYWGPIFRQAIPEGPQLRVWFHHATGGLMAKGGELKSFEVAGADRKFVPASARIDGECVIVSSPAVSKPRYVRYAWSDNPEANLYNSKELPASPFRSGE